MKLTVRKKVLISLFLVLATGAAVAYYLYNKGPINVKNEIGIKIAANELYNIFSTDSALAGKRYSNHILQVKGEINSIATNNENKQIVTLKTATEGGFINCVMEENIPIIIQTGNTIQIKGICSGQGAGEPDLGIMGDVYMSRCYLIN